MALPSTYTTVRSDTIELINSLQKPLQEIKKLVLSTITAEPTYDDIRRACVKAQARINTHYIDELHAQLGLLLQLADELRKKERGHHS